MKHIVDLFKKNIDDNTCYIEWDTEAKKRLSLYIAGSYKFYKVTILQTDFLLIKPYEQETIKKQMSQMASIENASEMPVALLLDTVSSYRLKKSFQEKIAFITIDGQMYLPFLALQINAKRNKIVEKKKIAAFTASTQMIYLWILYSFENEFTLEKVAEKLEISVMTALRGMNILQELGLLNCEISGKTGRKKVFRRIEQSAYYRIGKEYLCNPVRKTIYVLSIPKELHICKSDLTALGEQTMLGEPKYPIYAVDGKREKELCDYQISEEQAKEEGLPCVQLMKYDIELLSENGYEDPISLLLGLSDRDERIEMAIEELMEGKKWYQE